MEKIFKERFRIAFFSGKLGDVDGVSLEVDKWIKILAENGHEIFTIAGYYANELEFVAKENQILFEDIRFDSEKQRYYEKSFFPFLPSGIQMESSESLGNTRGDMLAEGEHLGRRLYGMVQKFGIDVIIAENTNAMPMTLLGGLALQFVVSRHRVATVFHHHDFWWERSRFSENSIEDILNKIMPPRDIGTEHVVISSYASHLLRSIKRVNPRIVPNCEDFDSPTIIDEWNRDFRRDFGFSEDDILVVQPTRIISRKRIEDSLRLLGAFVRHNPDMASRMNFIISLYQGDELEGGYIEKIRGLAKQEGIRLFMIADRVSSRRTLDLEGRKIYTTRDVLVNADLATYLPVWEGFGNACLEAIACRVPTVVTTYLTYKTDIQGAGFQNIEIRDIYDSRGRLLIPDEVHQSIRAVLTDKEKRERITSHNFTVGEKEFGMRRLKDCMDSLLEDYSDEIRASRRRLAKSMVPYFV